MDITRLGKCAWKDKVHGYTQLTPPLPPLSTFFSFLFLVVVAIVPIFQMGLDMATARRVTSVGEGSLKHIVGGEENLWGRSFFPAMTGSSGAANLLLLLPSRNRDAEYDGCCFAAALVDGRGRRRIADTDKEATSSAGLVGRAEGGRWSGTEATLLAARLQSAVALGRAPAVARALTAAAVLPGAGMWALPRALPVQVGVCVGSGNFLFFFKDVDYRSLKQLPTGDFTQKSTFPATDR